MSTNITKNKKNKNLEISDEIAATEGSPNMPAMIAIMRKINAHFNMATLLVFFL